MDSCLLRVHLHSFNSTLLDYQNESLLAHAPELQMVLSVSFPGHPPVPGFAPLHTLFLVLVPRPQVALQAPYDDH